MFFFRKSQKKLLPKQEYVLFSLTDLKKSIADEVRVNVDKMVSKEFLSAERVRRLRQHLKQKIHKKEQELYKEHQPYLWPFIEICPDMEDYSKMYSSTEDALQLLRSLGHVSTVNVPLLKRCFESFFKIVQNLPCRNLKDGHIFSHTVELTAEMMLIAKKKTYLYCDYNTQSVSFALLLIGMSHDIREVFSYRILGGRAKEEFNPYTTTLYDFCYRKMEGSLYELNEQYPQLTVEQSMTLSHLCLKEVWDEILLLLLENHDDTLQKELLQFSKDSLLYKVYTFAHRNIQNHHSVDESDEFLETVRPVISGRATTPKNWHEDAKLRQDAPLYSENVLTKNLFALEEPLSLQKGSGGEQKSSLNNKTEVATTLSSSPPPSVEADKNATVLDIPLVFGEAHKEDSKAQDDSHKKIDPMATEAVNNRYLFAHKLEAIEKSNEGDENFLKDYKDLMVLALKKESKEADLKALLKKRIKKYHQFLEIEESFIKDKVTTIDYDLEHALKRAETFNDYFRSALCLEHALREKRKDNRLGLNYAHRFLRNEVTFFKKLFLI